MQFLRYFRDAAVALSSDVAALDEGRKFSLCKPDGIEGLFRSAGDAVDGRCDAAVVEPFQHIARARYFDP